MVLESQLPHKIVNLLFRFVPRMPRFPRARQAAVQQPLNNSPFHLYITQCINQMVGESHPPHKIVNLIAIVNSKLTILWGNWLSKMQRMPRFPRARQAAVQQPLHHSPFHLYITQCINQMVGESQPPHKIVNLLAIVNSKLTILWGNWLSKM